MQISLKCPFSQFSSLANKALNQSALIMLLGKTLVRVLPHLAPWHTLSLVREHSDDWKDLCRPRPRQDPKIKMSVPIQLTESLQGLQKIVNIKVSSAQTYKLEMVELA